MTNTNTITLTAAAAAMLTLNAQKDAGIIADDGNLIPNRDGHGRGRYLEMRLGNRTVYLVHNEGEGEMAVLMNARRSLLFYVWIDRTTGLMRISQKAKRSEMVQQRWGQEYLPVAEQGWAIWPGLHSVSDGHKGSAALRKFAINNEPELRFAIKALATLD